MSDKPTASATTQAVSTPGAGEETGIVVDVEVPEEIVDECRGGSGSVGDAVADRIVVRTDVDDDI